MLLKRNSTGPHVLALVKDLRKLGYYDGPDTSLFDQEVYKSVRAFQMQNVDTVGRPLVVDAIVGPVTLGAIDLRLGRMERAEPDHPSIETPTGDSIALRALAIAVREYNLGHGEVGGNNRGPHVRRYLNGLAPEGNPWCAGFVSWCYSQTGLPMPFRYSVGARDIRNQLRDRGFAFTPSDIDPPRAGDLIVWWRIAPNSWHGHIGFVLSCRDGVLTTIEGNKTPKVGRFDYTLASIERLLGFARVV